jgi:hypothetical protein
MATIFLVFNRFPRMLWVSLKAPTSLCGTSMFTKCYIPCYSLANRSKYFLRRQFHRDQYNINITFCWHIFQIWQIILSKGSTPDTITATKQFYKIVFALSPKTLSALLFSHSPTAHVISSQVPTRPRNTVLIICLAISTSYWFIAVIFDSIV